MRRPRVAIGGMHIESSTFSPHRSGPADFTVTRGDALLARYDALPADVEWVPLVHARALPGGAVDAAFYRRIKNELLERAAAAGALDGLYLDIHGAMSVVGLDDAEADLAWALRGVIGPDTLVSASMDPHGNMSRALASALDLATSHRLSPHEDAPLTKKRAMDGLIGCITGGTRPLRAWVRVPVLLPGERACTRDEPARSIFGGLASIDRTRGIIEAAVWIGYAWADEPRCSAAVLVTGTERDVIALHARDLARTYWGARAAFDFSAPAGDADWCIATALASAARPFFVSDSGDNPTAGGAGDVVFMLERLLAEPKLKDGRATAIWASVVDPQAVARCARAGQRATVDLEIGGALGSHGHVSLHATVLRIVRADPVAGDVVVVACGGVHAILTERRKPFHYVRDFTDLGLDPAAHDITVVKVGYLVPDLFAAAKGWVLALTPGGVDQHITRLAYSRLSRPMYPFDAHMAMPDLEPQLI